MQWYWQQRFHAREHEKISRLAIYCNRQSLLVPKLCAKCTHVGQVCLMNTKPSIAQLLLTQTQ